MLSKQCYETVAEVLRSKKPDPECGHAGERIMLRGLWGAVVEDFCRRFEEDNENFKPELFRKACDY